MLVRDWSQNTPHIARQSPSRRAVPGRQPHGKGPRTTQESDTSDPGDQIDRAGATDDGMVLWQANGLG
jgi:hypothetical protein